jgi:hypothetical protein
VYSTLLQSVTMIVVEMTAHLHDGKDTLNADGYTNTRCLLAAG